MADISYFYLLDDNGQPVLNDAGKPQIKWRGQTSTLAELKQMIVDNRPQKAIETYLGLVANGMNWAKYDEWLQRQISYENAMIVYKSQLNFYNSANNKDSLETPVKPTEPEPLSFEPVTVETVLSQIQTELRQEQKQNRESEFKNLTVEHNGLIYDADKESRSALVETVTLMQMAEVDVHPWKMADNTWHDVTLDDLVQVGLKISQAVMSIMQKYEV